MCIICIQITQLFVKKKKGQKFLTNRFVRNTCCFNKMCFSHAILIAIEKYVIFTCLKDTCHSYMSYTKFPTNQLSKKKNIKQLFNKWSNRAFYVRQPTHSSSQTEPAHLHPSQSRAFKPKRSQPA
jgi:hypothetical protein